MTALSFWNQISQHDFYRETITPFHKQFEKKWHSKGVTSRLLKHDNGLWQEIRHADGRQQAFILTLFPDVLMVQPDRVSRLPFPMRDLFFLMKPFWEELAAVLQKTFIQFPYSYYRPGALFLTDVQNLFWSQGYVDMSNMKMKLFQDIGLKGGHVAHSLFKPVRDRKIPDQIVQFKEIQSWLYALKKDDPSLAITPISEMECSFQFLGHSGRVQFVWDNHQLHAQDNQLGFTLSWEKLHHDPLALRPLLDLIEKKNRLSHLFECPISHASSCLSGLSHHLIAKMYRTLQPYYSFRDLENYFSLGDRHHIQHHISAGKSMVLVKDKFVLLTESPVPQVKVYDTADEVQKEAKNR